MRNKKLLSTILAGVLALSMAMPVAAAALTVVEDQAGQGSNKSDTGTQVWAGVVYDMKETHISVNVPTLFAFVVNGKADDSNQPKVMDDTTGENAGLYLPNFKVTDVSTGTYKFGTVGEAVDSNNSGAELEMTNLSTIKKDNNYEGLDVNVVGSVSSESNLSKKYWKHVTKAPGTTVADFKTYMLSVGGKEFSLDKDGSHYMSGAILLEGQEITDQKMVDTAGTKTVLEDQAVPKKVLFNVTVGGTRSMYNQVEQSVGINTITWNITATQDTTANTNPDNAPLNR